MRKSRLSKVKQDRLMEHFVAGTTARCAVGLVGINFKTAAYYYHRLRMLICLATEKEPLLPERLRLMKGILEDIGKANAAEGRQGVHQSHYRHKSKNTDGYYAKTD
jgi:transposase-like protein